MREELCISIQSDLRAVERVLHDHLGSDQPLINDVARYIIDNGGKRIRPALFLLASRMAGASGEHLPRVAAAFELYHTASLMHDDVVDDSSMRRGKPSAKIKWGNQVSVLVGDYMWSKGSELLIHYGSLPLLQVVIRAVNALSEGEMLEISRHNDLTMDQEGYVEVIRRKTSALFSACCEGAGIVAGVSEEFTSALARYGVDFGIAFQLADDSLDYVADESCFGKKAGGDLREGKLTFPLIEALRRATAEETQLIRSALIADHLSDAQFRDVLNVIQRYDAIEATVKLARRYAERAKQHLSIFKPCIEREALMAMADYAMNRAG